jgi:hypothetical protein
MTFKQELLNALNDKRPSRTKARPATTDDIERFKELKARHLHEYFAKLGRKGGAKSKRVLTPEQARAMVKAREAKRIKSR